MNFKNKLDSLIEELQSEGIIDKRVLEVIKEVPRHLFVKKEYLNEAYSNYPLPIGHEATISQPYTVAFMLQHLELKETDKVLEIGTGSGWNSALISKLAKEVYTLEVIPELVKLAKSNLKKLNIKNVKIFLKDGSKGLEQFSPYNKIIVTASHKEIPKALIQQLNDNGILIAPIGSYYPQEMIKLKKENKRIKKETLGNFIFVPLKTEK